jgi:predicted dehydrogenase
MIRLGVIGAGRMARDHVDYFVSAAGCRVVAIADPDLARAEALAISSGATAVTDATELLGGVDAVVIASPNRQHRDHAVAAAAAGRHVYCEKPGGQSLADAEDIADAVHEAGVVATVGYAVRHSPQIRTMHDLYTGGRLGDLRSLGSRRLWGMTPADRPPWYRDLPGGHLLEISVHELDWMLALGGPVASVYARAQDRGISGIDSLWITLQFADGAVGWHEGSWSASLPMFHRAVEGARAGVATDEWGDRLYFGELGADRRVIGPAAGFDLRRDFLTCIETGRTPVADVDWNLTVMAVADAVLTSIRTGEPQPVAYPSRARPAALWRRSAPAPLRKDPC